MIKRSLLFVGVLAAAVVVPYLLLDEHLVPAARGQLGRLWHPWDTAKADLPSEPAFPGASGSGAGLTPTAAASARAVGIEEAFRFDIHPQWVTSRWPRVSTVLGEPQQLGMRVALVSGTRPDDVAGSLTYYFDDHHQLQRITFAGVTGDARRIVAATVTPYGLKSQPTTDAAHYIAGDPKRPTSEVTIRHLPIVRADVQRARAEVSVDLRRSEVVGWGEKAAREPEPKLVPASYRRW
jgi:Family of unknown function (DUF6690)